MVDYMIKKGFKLVKKRPCSEYNYSDEDMIECMILEEMNKDKEVFNWHFNYDYHTENSEYSLRKITGNDERAYIYYKSISSDNYLDIKATIKRYGLKCLIDGKKDERNGWIYSRYQGFKYEIGICISENDYVYSIHDKEND